MRLAKAGTVVYSSHMSELRITRRGKIVAISTATLFGLFINEVNFIQTMCNIALYVFN